MRALWLACGILLLPIGAQAQQFDFGAYLDGKRIGFHRFTVERTGPDEAYLVRSHAEFDVKVLWVSVYRYRHTAVETWRNGCLQSIDTQTQVNRERTTLTGHTTAAGFEVDVASSSSSSNSPGGDTRHETLPLCVASYAYWNADLLQQHDELLNSQTGKYQSVQRILANASDRTLLELKGSDFRIDVLYADSDGSWVGLHTTVEGGRSLDYRLDGQRER